MHAGGGGNASLAKRDRKEEKETNGLLVFQI